MDVYSPLSFSIHWRIYPEQLDIKKRDTQNRKEVKTENGEHILDCISPEGGKMMLKVFC